MTDNTYRIIAGHNLRAAKCFGILTIVFLILGLFFGVLGHLDNALLLLISSVITLMIMGYAHSQYIKTFNKIKKKGKQK